MLINTLNKALRGLGDYGFKIEIFLDAVIFLFYDAEIPLVYDIKTQTVSFRPFYMQDFNEDFELDSELFAELSMLMSIVESHKDEIQEWIEG